MMPFAYKNGVLHAEDVALPFLAKAHGTPTYVYSARALRAAAGRFRSALTIIPAVQLAFAVKANPKAQVGRHHETIAQAVTGRAFQYDAAADMRRDRATDGSPSTSGPWSQFAPPRVNKVFPGCVAAEIYRSLPAQVRAAEEARLAGQPAPRIAAPGQVVEANLYAMKCTCLTGQVLMVHGGGRLD